MSCAGNRPEKAREKCPICGLEAFEADQSVCSECEAHEWDHLLAVNRELRERQEEIASEHDGLQPDPHSGLLEAQDASPRPLRGEVMRYYRSRLKTEFPRPRGGPLPELDHYSVWLFILAFEKEIVKARIEIEESLKEVEKGKRQWKAGGLARQHAQLIVMRVEENRGRVRSRAAVVRELIGDLSNLQIPARGVAIRAAVCETGYTRRQVDKILKEARAWPSPLSQK